LLVSTTRLASTCLLRQLSASKGQLILAADAA
jgi:hypothetical protein